MTIWYILWRSYCQYVSLYLAECTAILLTKLRTCTCNHLDHWARKYIRDHNMVLIIQSYAGLQYEKFRLTSKYLWTTDAYNLVPILDMVGIPADQNSPKWSSTGNIWNLVYWYLIHIFHMSKCNWNRYIVGFCMWNVHFHINGLSPNIAYVIVMSWPLMAICFLLIELLTIFCAVFILYLMSKYSMKFTHDSHTPHNWLCISNSII